MKSKMQIGIALGFMCIILTSCIMIQLNTINEAKKIVGTSYAQEELKDEVLKWKENYERKYEELENKEKELESERQNLSQGNSKTLELQKELDELNKLLGLTEIKGSGIILTIRDSEPIASKDLGIDATSSIVHDEDLRQLVNELKNAGAEAISINDQRIISTTAISCEGNVININGQKVGAPFVIKAIGLPESLSNLDRPRGYLDLLEDFGIGVDLQKSNNITIPKYNGKLEFTYGKSVNE